LQFVTDLKGARLNGGVQNPDGEEELIVVFHQWCAEGGERGDGPGHPRQGGIQRVKLQKVKCCN